MENVIKNILEHEKQRMQSCDHLFVKISEDKDTNKEIIQCVHCGLTNKYMYLNNSDINLDELKRYKEYAPEYMNMNNIIYNRQYVYLQKIFGNNFSFHSKRLMSDEILASKHLSILYQGAKLINPHGSNEELFKIMERLYDIETDNGKYPEEENILLISLLEEYRDTYPNETNFRKI